MVPFESLMIAETVDGNNSMGWLPLLVMIVAALALAWVSKLLRTNSTTNPASDNPASDNPASEVVSSSQAITPELLVVLTAAATAALGTPVIVHRITFLNQNTVSGWAEAGRTSLHWSHNVRRNN
jgi:hypothetical protein